MNLSTGLILQGAAHMARHFAPRQGGDHLDIGAGHGDLIAIIQKQFAMNSCACDSRADLMRVANIHVDISDLNRQKLPYVDKSFDLVTCTEVIEHLENFRFVLRESFRVLRPGGVFVVTTPNVLNLASRIRYLTFGFANLFGPLKLQSQDRHLTNGHISPISHFYLIHALAEAGFIDMRVAVDKWQQRSLAWAALLWIPIKIGAALARSRERKRYGTIEASNEAAVRQINSLDIMLGRTMIVGCRKPLRS